MQDTIDRRAALDQLIAHAIEAIREDGGADWLRLMLRRGFVGFENMPENQLRKELELRGLRAPALAEEAVFDSDADDDWEMQRELGGLRAQLGDAA